MPAGERGICLKPLPPSLPPSLPPPSAGKGEEGGREEAREGGPLVRSSSVLGQEDEILAGTVQAWEGLREGGREGGMEGVVGRVREGWGKGDPRKLILLRRLLLALRAVEEQAGEVGRVMMGEEEGGREGGVGGMVRGEEGGREKEVGGKEMERMTVSLPLPVEREGGREEGEEEGEGGREGQAKGDEEGPQMAQKKEEGGREGGREGGKEEAAQAPKPEALVPPAEGGGGKEGGRERGEEEGEYAMAVEEEGQEEQQEQQEEEEGEEGGHIEVSPLRE